MTASRQELFLKWTLIFDIFNISERLSRGSPPVSQSGRSVIQSPMHWSIHITPFMGVSGGVYSYLTDAVHIACNFDNIVVRH